MFEELEELVSIASGDTNNFTSVKHEINKIQEDHAEEINGNVCNEWMFKSLIKAYTSTSLYPAIGSKFGKGQYGSARNYLKMLMANLRLFGHKYSYWPCNKPVWKGLHATKTFKP